MYFYSLKFGHAKSLNNVASELGRTTVYIGPMPHHALARIHPSISRWLGYRSSYPKPLSSYLVAFWSFIAAFCGMSVIQAAFRAHYFTQRAVPSVIASYVSVGFLFNLHRPRVLSLHSSLMSSSLPQGASAILIYGSIDSPLAQPRALIGGHFIGALLGVSISKLFQLLPPERYTELQWLAGSLAVSLALVAMQFTKTVHPPAGATALLAAVNQQVIDLSWYLLPVILLSSTLALAVALVVDNIQRRYPVFWFTADAPLSVSPPTPSSSLEDGNIDSPKVDSIL